MIKISLGMKMKLRNKFQRKKTPQFHIEEWIKKGVMV